MSPPFFSAHALYLMCIYMCVCLCTAVVFIMYYMVETLPFQSVDLPHFKKCCLIFHNMEFLVNYFAADRHLDCLKFFHYDKLCCHWYPRARFQIGQEILFSKDYTSLSSHREGIHFPTLLILVCLWVFVNILIFHN